LPAIQQQIRSYAKRSKDTKKESLSKKGKGPDKPHVELSENELNEIIDFETMRHQMDATFDYLRKEFAEQLTLRTSINVFNGLVVDTPDGQFPLVQIAQVVQKNPQLVLINAATTPQYIAHIKTAIANSGLNINPQQDGTSLFLPIPRITREHREGLAKNAKALADKTKDKLRNIQNNYDRELKKAKEEHSADLVFNLHETILSTAKTYFQKVDDLTLAKQRELLND